jgi:hypothetical protein
MDIFYFAAGVKRSNGCASKIKVITPEKIYIRIGGLDKTGSR